MLCCCLEYGTIIVKFVVNITIQVQDLKNADGFMGKMTGNVSDPFCEIFMQDFRNNSHTTVAEFKVCAS